MPMGAQDVFRLVADTARSRLVPATMTAKKFDEVLVAVQRQYLPELHRRLSLLPWGGLLRRAEIPEWIGSVGHHPVFGVGVVEEIRRAGREVQFRVAGKVELVPARVLKIEPAVTAHQQALRRGSAGILVLWDYPQVAVLGAALATSRKAMEAAGFLWDAGVERFSRAAGLEAWSDAVRTVEGLAPGHEWEEATEKELRHIASLPKGASGWSGPGGPKKVVPWNGLEMRPIRATRYIARVGMPATGGMVSGQDGVLTEIELRQGAKRGRAFVRESTLRERHGFYMTSNERWGEKTGAAVRDPQALELALDTEFWDFDTVAELVHACDDLRRPVKANRRFTTRWAIEELEVGPSATVRQQQTPWETTADLRAAVRYFYQGLWIQAVRPTSSSPPTRARRATPKARLAAEVISPTRAPAVSPTRAPSSSSSSQPDPCPECGVDPVVRVARPCWPADPSRGTCFSCAACERTVPSSVATTPAAAAAVATTPAAAAVATTPAAAAAASSPSGVQIHHYRFPWADQDIWERSIATLLSDFNLPTTMPLHATANRLARSLHDTLDDPVAAGAVLAEFHELGIEPQLLALIERLAAGRVTLPPKRPGVEAFYWTLNPPPELRVQKHRFRFSPHETLMGGEDVALRYRDGAEWLRVRLREPGRNGLSEISVESSLRTQPSAPWFIRIRDFSALTGRDVAAAFADDKVSVTSVAKVSLPPPLVQIEARRERHVGGQVFWVILLNGLEFRILLRGNEPTEIAAALVRDKGLPGIVQALKREGRPAKTRPLAPSEIATARAVLPGFDDIVKRWSPVRAYDFPKLEGARTWHHVLIGCGKTKKRGEEQAIDMYTGPIFLAHAAISEHVYLPGADFVLSAQHGLLPARSRIQPYDATLDDADYRRKWDAKIVGGLARMAEQQGGLTLLVLAGGHYLGWRVGAEKLGIVVDDPLQGLEAGQRRAFADRFRRETPGRTAADREDFDFSPREQLLGFAQQRKGATT